MKKSGATKLSIIIILLVAAVVGYYAYLSSKSKVTNIDKDMTKVQAALSRNLQSDYPSTPKEVMKYYHQLMECFYDANTTDEELNELGIKARELYAEELLENNPTDTYLISLKNDVSEFHQKNRTITSFSVPSAASVDPFNLDGYSFARITCSYNMVDGGTSTLIRTVYLLKRDSASNRWKIYGWEPESVFLAAQSEAEAAEGALQAQPVIE